MAKAVKDAGGIDKVRRLCPDLRNNPGRPAEQAIEVSDAFLDKGARSSTRGRKPEERNAGTPSRAIWRRRASRWWR